jgi:hypothetical protein
MSKNNDEFSVSDALQLAKSKQAQQLYQTLRAKNGAAIDSAMAHLASGNQEQAKSALSSLLRSPEVKAMLEQLGRNPHG